MTSTVISNFIFLSLIGGIPLFAYCRRIAVYDEFLEGAKEGIPLIVKLVPYLVAMIVGIGMLRASGFFENLAVWFAPILAYLGIPEAILPLALIRPFSGSASNAMLVNIIDHYGGDAFVSQVAATLMGSTETTFYVVAVYFGVVHVKQTRHAIPVGLLADFTGVLASVWICRLLFT